VSSSVKAAEVAFDKAIRVPNRVLEVQDLVRWKAGYPVRQQALYEAAVVLTIAAWQTFTEDIARTVLARTAESAGSQGAKLALLAGGALEESIQRFNTPNMPNVEELFKSVGFDLGTAWSVTLGGAPLMSKEAVTLVNAWLQVRHSVAHGVPFHKNQRLMNLRGAGSYVQSRVLTRKKPGLGSAIAFGTDDAAGCRDLFVAMKGVVGAATSSHCKSL
jgi:hypothetical protein